MVLYKRIWYFFTLIALLGVSIPTATAQQNADLTTIKVDELTDEQVEELVKRANDAGLGVSDFLQMAQLRGMPSVEVEKLRNRIGELSGGGSTSRSAGASSRDPRKQLDLNQITQGLYDPQAELTEKDSVSHIFGASLFYQKKPKA